MAPRKEPKHNPEGRDHIPGYIYVFLRHDDGAVKIGYSRDPKKRVSEIATFKANGRVSYFSSQAVACMACAEVLAHGFAQHRRLPRCPHAGVEWFDLRPESAMQVIRNAALFLFVEATVV